jgi:phosphoribosylaminoimidazolecarboxamide formyltransferase/IMP cyclohydrolase
VGRFEEPACVIVKHNEPCGAALGDDLTTAYEDALRCDEQSAYGGIVALNRTLDRATAEKLAKQFVECVAAPGYDEDALPILQQKKNLRALRLSRQQVAATAEWRFREVGRWALLQHEDDRPGAPWRFVTRRAPGDLEIASLQFAWTIVSAARSNAITIANGTALIGLGSGQTSRVDAVDLALMKAKRAGHDVRGAVLASDGFFPFPDNIEHAAAAGITAVVQPGGSMRDSEVIAACDRLGVAMAFTDRRTFRH